MWPTNLARTFLAKTSLANNEIWFRICKTVKILQEKEQLNPENGLYREIIVSIIFYDIGSYSRNRERRKMMTKLPLKNDEDE